MAEQMIRVFLVDDEIVIREGIRNSFPWDETGFTLVGEAPDGEMAFPMIQDLKPDILITDIRMPFMDGLALARKVAQALPFTYIIILSGYDDFQYAQEAISIGVRQYILKPVTSRKLEEALHAMAERIRQDQERQADTALLMGKLASSARIAREQVLFQLMEGNASSGLLEEAASLGLPAEARHYLVMLLGEVPDEHQLGLVSSLQRLTEGVDPPVFCTTRLESPALLLASHESLSPGAEELEERAYALAQALEHEAIKNKVLFPSVAIGSPVSRLADLPQALASARAVLQAVKGRPPRIVGALDVDLSASPALLEAGSLPLYERLLYAASAEGGIITEQYFRSLGDLASQSLLVLNYLLMDVLLAASRIIRQCGGEPAEVLPAWMMQQTELMKLSQRPERALAAGREMIEAALSFRDSHAASRYGEILRRAQAYIDENFQRSDLTLQDVAGHVALSNNHFSTVFSQEMGVTFTEYLTGVRLDKAKQLLVSTASRSAEISAAIGYNDPHYFSYLFKKQVGQTPRDFRKSQSEDVSG